MSAHIDPFTINRYRLTHGLDLPNQTGIEIGPLVNPVVRRGDSNVKYVDRASTEELREWYSRDSAINVDDIMEIDYIWGEQSLAEATGGTEQFDYCVASHVIEHIPDLITWLGEIASILKVGGKACFAVPDKRYTFDYLRPLTVPADLVDGYLNKRRQPSYRHIYDHFSNFVELDINTAWSDDFDGSELVPQKSAMDTFNACIDAKKGGKYIDSHCSVFTEKSFFELLGTVAELGLLDFRVHTVFPVQHGMFEFYVHLEKLESSLPAVEKASQFAASLAAIKETYLEMDLNCNVACASKIYFDLGHGFNEHDSVTLRYAKLGTTQRLRFNLPLIKDLKFRFDPTDCEAQFTISNANYSFAGDTHAIPLDAFAVLSDITSADIRADSLVVETTKGATDPAFSIAV